MIPIPLFGWLVVLLFGVPLAASASGDPTPSDCTPAIALRSVVDDRPLVIPEEEVTDAVAAFLCTGRNPLAASEEAAERGRELYRRNCQICHAEDGDGRMGPSLIDDVWMYDRVASEVGRFEIIYGGGVGVMRAFKGKLPAEDILAIMAYIGKLRERAAGDGRE